ncbi:MAG: glycoside hydrolase/phage tail family protein [Pseudomonadota bacterium]
MATIILSAVGSAIGGAVGGGVLGLSSAVIGRAIGATIGRSIDQKLLGGGSQTVEVGQLDRLRILGASEGSPVSSVYGRMRTGGNVIWTSNFNETVTTSQASGGKGAPSGPTTREYSYAINLAIALGEGPITRVGRVWVDGAIFPTQDLNMRVYRGTEDQQPDPLMEAIEGPDEVPAYRGLAYVVLEELDLSQFGNRVPQFSFEVIRPSEVSALEPLLAESVEAVALMPGTGEFALATEPVYKTSANGTRAPLNLNTPEGRPDFNVALEDLQQELPNCRATSLIISWFGDDLRIGNCRVLPKVESNAIGGAPLGSAPVGSVDAAWSVSGVARAQAEVMQQIDGRPIYGGTPDDASVVQAISALRSAGQDVMFYPFILMEITEGNGLPDPWSDATSQPVLPWRGRITTQKAPGQPGSTDGTAAALAEVTQFMGQAAPGDFQVVGSTVNYTGPQEYSYRRFILHYAHLCAAAGGVSSFCIGSEMRGMTQIRDDSGGFPAVEALRQLAGEVRAILGPDTKISYAADWSEYFGYQPQDGTGDVLYHLDPLWADPAIDFIGIDNYMPLSDWRDGDDHLDRQEFKSIYDLDYLRANIEGGEGYDWYYRDPEERDLQIRTAIEDGAEGEPWIYRYKDLRNWWGRPHHERIGGVRNNTSTAWVPESKPIWFTELGCAAIDKGSNQPNKFLDPKSSESAIPHFSNGRRDDYIQMQFLRAYYEHYATSDNNPVSVEYEAPMVDMSKAHIWAWDARPWPDFPNNLETWSDGDNHLTGHWLTGRTGTQPLSHVVARICEASGITQYDVRELHGIVRGYSVDGMQTARAQLQPLMVAFGFDAIEEGGTLIFRNRDAAPVVSVAPEQFLVEGSDSVYEQLRAPEAEIVGQVRLGYVEADGEFTTRVADARFPDDITNSKSQNDMPLSLIGSEARGIAERWLAEARVARDSVRFTLPPSRGDVHAGDLVEIEGLGVTTLFRVDRVEDQGPRIVEAVRAERQIYTPSDAIEETPVTRPFQVPIPISAQFLDLPLLTGNEVPHAPYVAATAQPWPGGAAVYSAPQDNSYTLNSILARPAIMGVTQSDLAGATSGIWDRGEAVRVQLLRGALSSVTPEQVLNGANVAALGDGSNANWEVFQFAEATLVAPGLYDVSIRLRGQAGTEHLVPPIWQAGSRFVLLNTQVEQIELDLSARDLARHYRIGPSTRPLDDPSYSHYVEAIKGAGLRPYAPAQLTVLRDATDLMITWIRRTRIDGDSWSSVEVPLGEDSEAYLLRVSKSGSVLREVTLGTADWTYSEAQRTADGALAPFEIEVAQISQSYGPGAFARIEINA